MKEITEQEWILMNQDDDTYSDSVDLDLMHDSIISDLSYIQEQFQLLLSHYIYKCDMSYDRADMLCSYYASKYTNGVLTRIHLPYD